MTALRARRSWTLLASACLAIALVAPAAAERSSEPLSDPIIGTLIGEAIGDPADSGGDAAEPAQTPRPLTLGKSAGEDPGMSVVDPSLYDLVPNYFYVTHVRDLRIGASEFEEVDVEFHALNGSSKESWVRIQGLTASGAILQQDRRLGPGERATLIQVEVQGSVFEGAIPAEVEWFVIASDRPLFLFGDFDAADLDTPSQVNNAECITTTAWAGKRSFEIREVSCASAPVICALATAQAPWPVGD
jgi:hypothetical protein